MSSLPSVPRVELPTTVSLKNIAVALEFSAGTERLLSYARSLAREFGATLHLVHVVSGEEFGTGAPLSVSALQRGAKLKLAGLRDALAIESIKTKLHVPSGDAVGEVSRIAGENDIDLVIVGTSGRTGFNRFRMGSVAEGIFRNLNTPVMTIGPCAPNKSLGTAGFHKIIFATDLSDQSDRAAEYTMEIARKYRSYIEVVHILPKVLSLNPQARQLCEIYQHQLRKLVPPAIDPYHTDYLLEFGDPQEIIVNLAHTWESHLIVLGVRRALHLTSHLPGHVAFEVARCAPCPVLTVRSSHEPKH